jgi:NAD(P)-dependent dehydrogenase (short-subunit alcohol dehydrogenase family)
MQDYNPPADILKQRVILITGAGCGIGRAAAESFAAHGATVILLGPIQRQLEEVYDAIEQAGNPQAAMFVLDLNKAEESDYPGLANSIGAEFGRLDGLFHNAAALPFLSRMDDYELDAWEQVMRVNVTAPFLLTQACLPLLRVSADARIVFNSDAVGRQGKAYWGAYGVSKFAAEGMMQILADELGDSSAIRVNSIDPGPVRTDLRAKVYPGVNPDKWPKPESILAPLLYLMGPDSKAVNGRMLQAQTPA